MGGDAIRELLTWWLLWPLVGLGMLALYGLLLLFGLLVVKWQEWKDRR